MSRRFVAFAVLALTGALFCSSEPVAAAGGVRALPGGLRAPLFVQRTGRAALMRSAPRGLRAVHGFSPHRSGTFAHPRAAIAPSPHGFATTTPLRPFAGLTRRHHGIYRSGWFYPVTIGDGLGDNLGYIGAPYDPAEAFPVYGPAPQAGDPPPAPQADDPPAPPSRAARMPPTAEETRDACRSEQVTVPAAEGERTITVVRC